jgi:hypothetical protein
MSNLNIKQQQQQIDHLNHNDNDKNLYKIKNTKKKNIKLLC